MKKALSLALCLSTSLWAGALFAADADVKVQAGEKTYKTELTTGGKICTAKDLIGARLNDAQGEKIGQIEDLVLDPNSGRMQFAVVKLSRNLGGGKAFAPLPLGAFQPDMTRDVTGQPGVYVLTVDRNKLTEASRFNVERWPADRTIVMWGPDVYVHYGLTWEPMGTPGTDVEIQTGRDRSIDDVEPPVDYREKSIDNGTAPDGKTTFPFLHEQTDRD
ncbi:MAG: PRC-barrel domain-containing protein [Verrucomicrobia subdivision 3 bacterium]|nr:PRC-barrel domain-containing protein [Limisphaerales bacterium]